MVFSFCQRTTVTFLLRSLETIYRASHHVFGGYPSFKRILKGGVWWSCLKAKLTVTWLLLANMSS